MEDAATVIKHTVKSATRQDLTLRNLYLLEVGAKTLAKHIPNENDYTRLAVEKCSLGDDGAKILAKQALNVPAKCRHLQGLYLCENGIGPAGAKTLAASLQHLHELRTLRLDSNCVQDEGAKALFQVLPDSKLERIGLMNNQIGDKGANALAKVMGRCPDLTSVNLMTNKITDSSCRKIMLALRTSNCDHLELSLNNITPNGEVMIKRGRVQQARERKIRKAFDTIDEDGSGELDKHEVAAMSAALGAPLVESMGSIHLSTRKLDEAFAQMDPDGSGGVSYYEFRSWYDKYVVEPVSGALELEPEPEPEAGQDGDDEKKPKVKGEATLLIESVWEYRRRAILPPALYNKEEARKMRAELAEMEADALREKARALGVAEDLLLGAGKGARGKGVRDFALKLMDFAFKMMNLSLKMIIFAFKMIRVREGAPHRGEYK